MKVDLSVDDMKLLRLACEQETLYYKRSRMVDLLATGAKAQQEARQDFDKRNPGLLAKLNDASEQLAKDYEQLTDMFKNESTDFTMYQIDKLKDMIKDMPKEFDKHIVVKLQPDNTITYKHVNELVKIALGSAKHMMLDEFMAISRKLDGAY